MTKRSRPDLWKASPLRAAFTRKIDGLSAAASLQGRFSCIVVTPNSCDTIVIHYLGAK